MNFRRTQTERAPQRFGPRRNFCGRRISVSEADRPTADDTSDRTFNEEQKPLFESGGTPDKTRQRTPGTQSVPPADPAADTGDAPPEVSDVG